MRNNPDGIRSVVIDRYIVDPFASFLPKPFYIGHTCWFENTTPRPAKCGYLYVAADRSSESTDTIRLPVVIFRATEKEKKNDPVLYLEGGPSSALSDPKLTAAIWKEYLPQLEWLSGRDFIVFDYRGTGTARPLLECNELAQLGIGRWWGQKFSDALSTCSGRLHRNGIDLTHYHTPNIAADAHDLREALHIEALNLWGRSYGSRVALEVMRNNPDGIRSVVIDGILPPAFFAHWSNIIAVDSVVLQGIYERPCIPPDEIFQHALKSVEVSLIHKSEIFRYAADTLPCIQLKMNQIEKQGIIQYRQVRLSIRPIFGSSQPHILLAQSFNSAFELLF